MNNRFIPKSVEKEDAIQLLGTPKYTELGPDIHCLVWNICKAQYKNWLTDFDTLSADRNLVLLQEAVTNAPSDDLFNINEHREWVMAGSYHHPTSGVITGVKTGCVAKALRHVAHRSKYSEPLVKTQKLLLETHYSLRGSKDVLLVLNMHGINFVTIDKFADQVEQVSAALEAHTGPVILAGDFNTWNRTRLTHFQQRASEAGLVEASMTRNSKLRHLNKHLDHVFYRGLNLQSIESLAHIKSSDHVPIIASFVAQ